MDMSKVNSFCTRWLPTVLSLVAGSVDVISFLGLNGLFVSHITGNLVILAVQIVKAGSASLALILSVPIFIIVLGLTKWLVYGLDKRAQDSLRPLLFLQFIFLLSFLILCVTTSAHINSNTALAVLAGMCGVSAMAIQNALVQLSLKGVPATAVMTTNVTRFVMDAGEMLLSHHADTVAKARDRAKGIWPTIVGFIIGCALGATFEAQLGMWALTLPAVLSLLALVMGFFQERSMAP